MIGLKIIRKQKNLNQQKVAFDLNISRESLSYYENGKREPSLSLLVSMSKYFNVSIDYLFGKTDERSVPTKDEVIDVKKALDKIKNDLQNSSSLMFDGECLSEDAISSLLSAMEIGLSMAKKKQEESKNK